MEFLTEAEVELPFQFFLHKNYPINPHGSFWKKTPIIQMIARENEWNFFFLTTKPGTFKRFYFSSPPGLGIPGRGFYQACPLYSTGIQIKPYKIPQSQ